MNSRILVAAGLAAVVLIAAVSLMRRPAAPPQTASSSPPPSLRLVEGDLGRWDDAGQRYSPVAAGSEVEEDRSLMSGAGDAVMRLSSGGTLVAAPHTAFALGPAGARQSSTLRVRLDDGRLWLHLKAKEHLEVSSFHSLVAVGPGDAEVYVYKDSDRFINTVTRMWRGSGRVVGGEKLKLERPLADGIESHVDDVRVHPLRRFDTTRPTDWEKRMLALP
jgi:hypothetical protein